MPPPAENRTLDLITVSPVKNLLKCGSLVGFGQTELAPHFTSTLMPRLCGLQGIDPHELEASARCHIYDIKERYLDNLRSENYIATTVHSSICIQWATLAQL